MMGRPGSHVSFFFELVFGFRYKLYTDSNGADQQGDNHNSNDNRSGNGQLMLNYPPPASVGQFGPPAVSVPHSSHSHAHIPTHLYTAPHSQPGPVVAPGVNPGAPMAPHIPPTPPPAFHPAAAAAAAHAAQFQHAQFAAAAAAAAAASPQVTIHGAVPHTVSCLVFLDMLVGRLRRIPSRCRGGGVVFPPPPPAPHYSDAALLMSAPLSHL